MRKIEKEALKLSEAFNSFYRRFGYPLYKYHSVKESKWWKFFFKAADMYSNLEDWNAYTWVACQFEKHGKRFPTQLIGQEAFDTFQEYKHRFNNENTDDSLAMSLVSTYKIVKKWSEENGNREPNFKDFINDKSILFKLKRRNINPILFVITKSFYSIEESDREEIMSKEEIQTKRAAIFRNHKIKNKMKKVLDKEFI